MTTDEIWEALKEICGANRDKTKIATLVQVKKKDIDKAIKLIRSRSTTG